MNRTELLLACALAIAIGPVPEIRNGSRTAIMIRSNSAVMR